MNKIEQIWIELENDRSFSHGLLLRRYSNEFLPDVFIALKSPENYRCIATSIDNSLNIDISSFSNLRDINIDLIPDEKNSNKSILLFKLLSAQHRDIFSVLCEDLMTSISSITNKSQLVKEILNRFEKWKSLFDRASSDGLLAEEQRGLFGELFFLRKFLAFNSKFAMIIDSWIGPEKQVRDFQFRNWSVEAKTTHGNNHQRIHISSERQLDTTNIDSLFLYHLSLEARQESGETLNEIIDVLKGILSSDFIALNRFKSKLLEAGYFDQHMNLYSSKGYFVRQDVFYKVENSSRSQYPKTR